MTKPSSRTSNRRTKKRAPAKPVAPKATLPPEVAEETVDGEDQVLAPEPSEPDSLVRRITIGGAVEGDHSMMDLDKVLAVLGPAFIERVEALRGKSSHDQQSRMKASDGRCAPLFFTYDPAEPDKGPSLFNGVADLACALDCGLSRISVILVDTKDAGGLQSAIGRQVLQMQESLRESETDDDLYMQVQTYYDDV